MIFIDWISTPYHVNFNKSLFSALELKHALCYVFHQKLVINQVECQYIDMKSSRIYRTLEVVKLCWRHKKEKIVFVTYDPLFLPIFLIFKLDLIVYEHNTVPEKININKHVIWQRLLFWKVKRMAQFKGQVSVLKALKQNVCFVGSPILPPNQEYKVKGIKCKYYIAPSYRANLDNIETIIPFLEKNKKIVVKTAVWKSSNIKSKHITHIEHIDLDGDYTNICGVIITVTSRTRGTGWFNDAITFGLPIIVANKEAVTLFIENFPGYPFIDVSCPITKESLSSKLLEIREFNSQIYIEKHNSNFKKNFLQFCYSS
jgi:hypothetical protein